MRHFLILAAAAALAGCTTAPIVSSTATPATSIRDARLATTLARVTDPQRGVVWRRAR